MPRWLRITLTGLSFAMFFSAAALFGGLIAPLVWLLNRGDRMRHRERITRMVGRGYGLFLFWMKFAGLIGYRRLTPPAELEGSGGYVVVANHPSLIDVLFLLHYFEGSTCLVKAHWYRSLLTRPLLKATHYLPGPGLEGDDADVLEPPALERMVAHLKAGHPLVVFPEGTRSAATKLRRFQSGPFEAARRAGVPIVPVFIAVDQAFLMKGVPFWKVPPRRVQVGFELLPVVYPERHRSGGAIKRELERRYRQRLERWLVEREHGVQWEAEPGGAAQPAVAVEASNSSAPREHSEPSR